ncbi:MAG: hypothetical protein H7175_27035 [Burkholderiales bacterium]|nr:hypothetical protein [Anaerolineae bacterium]
MFRTLAIITLLITALTACGTTPNAPSAPTAVPFPSVTPGRLVRGILGLQPIGADSASLANPATAIALASQPTATPDTAACPAQNPDLTLPSLRPAAQDISTAIEQFLSEGGTVNALTMGLTDSWLVIGETGFVQSDADLTGEGSPDILVSYSADEGGTLLVIGCVDGVYQTRYQAITGGDAPEILWLGDVNVNASPEVVFSNRICPPDATADNEDELCTYRTQLISWQADQARFVSLLPGAIEGEGAPTVTDIDEDRILEVVSLITSDGTAATGPQRTGVNIWD